jgi:hypothetical protein
MADDDKDAIIIEIFSNLQSLANLRKQYDMAVSEGYINLSKARYSLGVVCMSPLSYPSSMTASVGVTNDSERKDIHFILSHPDDVNNEREEELLRQRKPEPVEDVKTNNDNKQQQNSIDPIKWFSALPPSSLRTSQHNFKLSIELTIALVNTQMHIDELVKKYKSLC